MGRTRRRERANGAESVATVSITYVRPHEPPIAQPGSTGIREGGTATGKLSSWAMEGFSLTFQLVTGPQYGTLDLLSDGRFTYTPNPGFSGYDSFDYTVFDGVQYAHPATFAIMVEPGPRPPLLVSATVTGYQGTPVWGAVFSVDDSDEVGARLSVASRPAGGKVKVFRNGTFRYKSRRTFLGADRFVVRATAGGVSTEATVDVTVLPTWASPAADFIVYDDPAVYYGGEQYAYAVSDGTTPRERGHLGVIIVLHEGATRAAAPGEPLNADLVVLGTPGIDRIRLKRMTNGRVGVWFNDRGLGTFAVSGTIRTYGLGNPDVINASSNLPGVEIYGGSGFDYLYGSAGPDLIFGGILDDEIHGGGGDDVLVGGVGGDKLFGDAGSDVLVSVPTLYELQPPAETAASLESVRAGLLAAWAGEGLFADKVAALSADGGPLSPAALVPDPWSTDALTGGADVDWFLARPVDATPDRRAEEPLTT